MSLTSYRAAPPRGGDVYVDGDDRSGLVARRRPTLPRLEAKYHGRWGVSRPSSGWDRVYQPRDGHRATEPDLSLSTDAIWMVMCRVFWSECGLMLRAVSILRSTASDEDEIYWAIRTAQLRLLPDFHLRPIDVVVFHGP
jgi:hypothetical protein